MTRQNRGKRPDMKLAIVAASCAVVSFAAWSAQSQGQAALSSPPAQVLDERPASEIPSRPKSLSLLVTSCNYGIAEMSDSYLDADRIQILRDQIAKDAPGLAGKVVHIKRYVAHINSHAAEKVRMSGAMGGGLGFAVMASINAKCPKEKTAAAWFAVDEVTTPYSPYVIEIAAEVDGKPYAVRTVYSTDSEVGWNKKMKEANRRNYVNGLAKANTVLIDAIAGGSASKEKL